VSGADRNAAAVSATARRVNGHEDAAPRTAGDGDAPVGRRVGAPKRRSAGRAYRGIQVKRDERS
jgi:hypothetical protein